MMNILMKVQKNKGSNVIKRVEKPIPEAITVYEMEFSRAIEYLSSLESLATDILLKYWDDEGIFTDQPEVTYLPLPSGSQATDLISKFVLDEYPDWERTQFIMEY